MTSVLVVILEAIACLGLGAAVLHMSRLLNLIEPIERVTWSFALGVGLLGWLLFVVGVFGGFHAAVLWPLLVLSASGIAVLRPHTLYMPSRPLGIVESAILAALAVSFAFDVLEAVSPPADADSMAYHFALPRQFIAAGALEFVPRAIDGAIPLLLHMTYVPALAFGGEIGLTLWTMLLSWMGVALSYSLARRVLDRTWSLWVALLLATTPAIVYGGGSGQIEPKLILFAVLAALTLAEAIRSDDLRFSLICGLAVGFFAASKYTGLLFALACGLSLVLLSMHRRGRWFRHGAVLTAATAIAGGEWYLWNWINTGDPVFPLLFGTIAYRDPTIWDVAHQIGLSVYQAIGEREVPVNLLWLISYPFVAILDGYPTFESGRTGIGPFCLLILPIALYGAWRGRRHIAASPLLALVSVAVLFYVMWFGSGFSQRIRHLLPIYPIVLVGLIATARRWSDERDGRVPLVAAAGLSIAIQIAGQTIFTRNFAEHVFSGESRDEFLRRNIAGYDAVLWINQHLGQQDRVLVSFRNLIYLFDVPVYYAHPVLDGRIDIRSDAVDPQRYLADLRRQGITHLLATLPSSPSDASGAHQWQALTPDCLKSVRTFDVESFQSRTLPTYIRNQERWGLFELNLSGCRTVTDEPLEQPAPERKIKP